MKFYFTVSFILIILALCMCKPKSSSVDCHNNGNCPKEFYRLTLQDVKPYIYSLPGSYWIYKNTKTGEIDTQTCVAFLYDSLNTSELISNIFINVKYDIIKRTIYSSFFKLNYSDETIGHNPNSVGFNNGVDVMDRRIDGQGSIVQFFHPFDLNSVFGNGTSNTKCLGIDSNVNIQNKSYKNVVKFQVDIDGIWENSPPFTGSVYCWAKEIGLIKRTSINKNYSWELIDYHIIQ